jgi:hypothetical protein
MSITISTKAYNQDRIAPDSIAYTGPANTLSVSDVLELKRVYPKPVKGFAGVAKPQAKITRTVTLADTTTAEAILTVSASLPVGIADADVASMIADASSLLALETANTTSLFKKLDITY